MALLLSLLLAATLFAGCNKPTKEIKKTTTFTVWWPFGSNRMSDLNESLFFQEMEKRTGVHINFVHNVTQDSYNLMLTSGEHPDMIVHNAGIVYPGGFDQAVTDGVYIKLNDLIEQYAPNYKTLRESNDQVRKETITDNGNLVAMYGISKNLQNSWYGYVVRKDWLDELGLPIPVTYDDWHTMLSAFKEKKNAAAPMTLSFSGFDLFDNMNAGFDVGQKFYQVDGKVKFGALEPGYKEYIALMREWYKEGLIDKDFYTRLELYPPTTYTTTGKSGAFSNSYVTLEYLKTASGDPSYEIVAVPAPSKNAGDVLHLKQSNYYTGAAIAITDACSDTVAAIKWIDYIFSPEGVLLSNYGIENLTFTYVEGKPVFTDLLTKNPNGLNLTEALYQYVEHTGPMEYHWERELSGLTADELAAPKIWGGQGNDGSYLMPAVTLSATESQKFTTIMGDVYSLMSELVVQYITGGKSMDQYNTEFVEQIKAMKINDAIAIQQAALDRYNKR